MAIDRPWPVDCWFIGRRPAGGAPSTAVLVLHDARFFPIPFAGLGVFALVVLFLALHQADLDLDPALFPVEGEGNDGVALAGDQALELVEFTAAQQQFAGPGRVAHHMAGGRLQWQEAGAEQVGLTIAEDDIGFADVGLARPQRFDFPPLQGQTRLDLLFDEVFVARASVECNGVGPGFVFTVFFAHDGRFPAMTGRRALYVGKGGCKTRSGSTDGFMSSLTEVLPPQDET